MKRILLFLLLLGALQMSGATKIAVLSDIHALSPRLVEPESGAFLKYADANMRMVKESSEILSAAIAQLLEEHPDVVLVAGDLTNNGERLSHEWVVSQFNVLQRHGIQVLVVPGNHDISNPYAKAFHALHATEAATITRAEFRRLYESFGYGANSVADDASLSYVAEPVEGLVVIGIDSNRDEENLLKSRGDSITLYHTAGRVKPSTLQWVSAQAREARARGKQVVAMMHHHCVEHFDGEARMLREYVVEDWEEVRNALIHAGVHVIFTGHLHITDIARDYNNGDSITDVATSSLSAYPFHYRIATVDGHRMDVDTRQVSAVPSNPILLAAGKAHVENAVEGLMTGMLNRGLQKIDGILKKYAGIMTQMGGPAEFNVLNRREEILALSRKHLLPLAQAAMVALYEGNEGANPQSEQIIADMENGMKQVLATILPDDSANFIHEFVQENLMPQLRNILRSMLQDRNHCGTPQETIVNDRLTSLPL
ncbi:MAG: metallophosphoesterase family protein [Sodaliphilus sp.]